MGQGGEILRCQGGRTPVASPWHRHYIGSRGAAGRVRSHIPGALSILKGAVPGRARGLGHMAPTYFRREPGIDTPTAIAARTFHPSAFSACAAPTNNPTLAIRRARECLTLIRLLNARPNCVKKAALAA